MVSAVSSATSRLSSPMKRPGTTITSTRPVKNPVNEVNVGWSRCHQLGSDAASVPGPCGSALIS